MIQERYGVRMTSRENGIEVLNAPKTIADYTRLHTCDVVQKETISRL